MPPSRDVEQVVKVYPEGPQALGGVSFAVEAGETVALVGESGSGKTTLLRLLNRRLEPTSGRVLVAGKGVARADPIALRRQLGYVPKDGGLLPPWTVARSVETVPQLLDLVAFFGVTYFGRYLNELSGGQRLIVTFVRALAAGRPISLLEEFFGSLDALTRRALLKLALSQRSANA